MKDPLLRVEALSKHFPATRGVFSRVRGHVRAVDEVTFDLGYGETLGLVGESGCGKSTVGRTLLRLQEPTSGNVWFEGRKLEELRPEDLQRTRRDMQIVFQDPYSSLNPRMRVFDIVGEALAVHGLAKGQELRRRVFELLEQVGVSARWADRYAHEFSGGQRQRIGIARAIALNPKLLICDEAVSALDVSIQAQIINLLIKLREQLGLSYLFISHDLSVVRHISHRVMVMYLGQVVELGPTRDLFERPAHPYTRALLSAVPVADPRRKPARVVLHGDVPSPLNPPSGCRFHTRCPAAFERCPREAPPLFALGIEQRTTRCLHAEGLSNRDDWYETLVGRFEAAEHENAAARLATLSVRETGTLASDTNAPDVARREGTTDWSNPVWPTSGEHVGMGRDKHAARPEALGWPQRLALIGFAALVAVSAMAVVQGGARGSKARREIAALKVEIEGYRATTQRLPASLSDLGYRLGFVFGPRRALDPWGNPYHYELAEGDTMARLWSDGPDGRSGTPDDVGASLALSAPQPSPAGETRL